MEENNSLPALPSLPDPYASATSMNKYVVGGLVFVVVAIVITIGLVMYRKNK